MMMQTVQGLQTTVPYHYEDYTEEDHNTWATLFAKLERRLEHCACQQYLESFRAMDFDRDRVVDMNVLSQRLDDLCGWQLEPASCMVSHTVFFNMLIEKKFPIMVKMREPDELDFAKLPDTFHDTIGHIPLLTKPKFSQYLIDVAQIAVDYLDTPEMYQAVARLLWYTLETGLIMEDGKVKAYGAAIITSEAECANFQNEEVPKSAFDLQSVLDTDFENLFLQKGFYIIPTFKTLVEASSSLRAHLGAFVDDPGSK